MKLNTLTKITIALFLTMTTAVAAKSVTMTASWYGPGMKCYPQPNGTCIELMANGERFNMDDPKTVAHKDLPFGTELRITNPANGRTIIGIVRDRGPFVKGRDIDLSRGAARVLGLLQKGVVDLEVEILS